MYWKSMSSCSPPKHRIEGGHDWNDEGLRRADEFQEDARGTTRDGSADTRTDDEEEDGDAGRYGGSGGEDGAFHDGGGGVGDAGEQATKGGEC